MKPGYKKDRGNKDEPKRTESGTSRGEPMQVRPDADIVLSGQKEFFKNGRDSGCRKSRVGMEGSVQVIPYAGERRPIRAGV